MFQTGNSRSSVSDSEQKKSYKPCLLFSQIIGTVLTLLGSLTATLSLRRLGKRGLTFLSMTLSVATCIGLGLYLSLGLHHGWIALGLFFLNFYAVPLGIVSIPWMLISELFPLR